KQLGVWWLDDSQGGSPRFMPMPVRPAGQVILTRLHVRYSAESFPEDLAFQETQDQESFQARYVIRHPWAGSADACPAARNYLASLPGRRETEAATLADLTGWDLAIVLKQAGLNPDLRPEPWWRSLWHASQD